MSPKEDSKHVGLWQSSVGHILPLVVLLFPLVTVALRILDVIHWTYHTNIQIYLAPILMKFKSFCFFK